MRPTTAIAGFVALTAGTIVGWSDMSSAVEDNDEEQAEAIVLTLDDLPWGWQQGPRHDDSDGEDAEDTREALAQCLGVDEDELEEDDDKVESPVFVAPDGDEVRAAVTVSSTEDAQRHMHIRQSEDAPACFATAATSAFEKALGSSPDVPADLTVGQVAFEPLDLADLGDESVAYRMTVPLTTQGTTVDLHMDLVAVRVGDTVLTGEFTAEATPFDTEEATQLMQTMVGRA